MNQGVGQFLYGIPKRGGIPKKNYVKAIFVISHSPTWGHQTLVFNAYITLSGAINRPRYRNAYGFISVPFLPGRNVTIEVEKDEIYEYLYLGGLNMKFIDITENTALKVFECHGNLLTSIDVTKNIQLISLKCNSNPLNSLDVTKNINLTNLECSNSQLTSLDVTKNTKLKTIRCNNNRFTTLDLSKNTLLTTFDSWLNNTLSTIYVNQDQLNKLNANQLPMWQKPATANYVLKP